MFDCTCKTQNSLLLNQHNGDDAPQDYEINVFSIIGLEIKVERLDKIKLHKHPKLLQEYSQIGSKTVGLLR